MWKSIVMAFWTFDLVHPWHEYFLREAKKYWEKLITMIARDVNVMKFKWNVPMYNENQRLQHVKNLNIADIVELWHETDYFFCIKYYKPDFIALWYDQSSLVFDLSKFLHENNYRTQVVTIDAFEPEKYKSSIIKSQNHRLTQI